MKICVLIPAFNVAAAIEPLVRAVRAAGFPVCVVNDGSTDDTGSCAAAAGAEVIQHLVNQGKGRAVIDGFRHIVEQRYDAVIVMDGDGQHDPADLPAFVRVAESSDVDVIVGNRMDDAAGMPLVRRVTNRAMSAILSALCRCRIPDSQCGYRLVRRRLLETITLSSARYDIESELLLKAAWKGGRVASVPIRTIYQHQKSHIHPVRDTVRFIRLLCSIRRMKRDVQ